MSRDEFIDQLQEALTGSVPSSVVSENVRYYNNYIDEEESKGRSEEEILSELGNPRLIAHTIIDTTPSVSGSQNSRNTSSGREYYQEDERGNGRGSSYHSFSIDFGKWYWRVIGFIILFAVIVVIMTVISGIMSLLFPVLPIIIIVAGMMWLFGGHGR